MSLFQQCVEAFRSGDLSICRPLGLDLGTWATLVGASLLTLAGVFWRAVTSLIQKCFVRFRRRPAPIPQPRPGELIGRELDLVRLEAALKKDPMVAITGQGGVGKTALAESFAATHTKRRRYRDWALLSVASEIEMAEGLRSIAATLGVSHDHPKTLLDLTYKAMAESGDRWLIILDNVDDEEDQRRVLINLRVAVGVHQIVTSRIKNWGDTATALDLEVLSADDAVKLLAYASGRPSNAALRRLATETLEGLPLALKVAGADLRAFKMGIAEYAAQFDARLRQAPQATAYDKSIYAAVAGSVERLSDEAQSLLKLAAFLAADDIDPSFIDAGVTALEALGWNRPHDPPFLKKGVLAIRAAAALCEQHSLLSPAKWEDKDTFRIHRLSQLVLRDWMGAETRKHSASTVTRIGFALFSDNPQFDVEAWPQCRRVASHARVLADGGFEADSDNLKHLAGLIHQTTTFLSVVACDRRLELQLRQRNLPNMEKAYGFESVEHAQGLGALADAQKELAIEADTGADEATSLKAQARQNYTSALAKLKIIGTEGRLKSAYFMNGLADLYLEQRSYSEAIEHFSNSLRILEDDSAPRELVGSAYGNIGVAYAMWSNSDSVTEEQRDAYQQLAYESNDKSLAITREALGELDIETSKRVCNLVPHFMKSDPARGLSYAIHAMAIMLAMVNQRLIASPQHPEVRHRLAWLRSALQSLNRDPDDAERLARAEIPSVLAAHAAWKARRTPDTASSASADGVPI